MPEITKEEAKKFLNNITKKDKVAIIHHNDADGFCSAILYYDFIKKSGAKIKTHPYELGKTTLGKLPIKSCNKIIITDVSSKAIEDQIEKIEEKEIFYTDHHPKHKLPKKIKQLITTKEYTPSSKTAYEITGKKKWLALIGTIADSGELYKENKKFINQALRELNLTLEEFKTKYAYVFSDALIYLENNIRKTFPILAKISSPNDIKKLEKYSNKVQKEIDKIVKDYEKNAEKIGNVNLYKFETKYNIKGIVVSIISRKKPEEIYIFLSKKKSNKKLLGISARHSSSKANLPKLLETITKDMEKSKCGGHLRASGGQIQAKDLEKFKKNIRKCLTK